MRAHLSHLQKNQFLLDVLGLVQKNPKFHRGLQSLLAFQLNQIWYNQILITARLNPTFLYFD